MNDHRRALTVTLPADIDDHTLVVLWDFLGELAQQFEPIYAERLRHLLATRYPFVAEPQQLPLDLDPSHL